MEQPPRLHGAALTDRLAAALAEAASGSAPDTIALMRVLIEAQDEAQARQRIEAAIASASAEPAARLSHLQALWQAHPDAWTTVRQVIDAIEHGHRGRTPDDTLRYLAECFDRLVDVSPEGSVALYSLGSPALLAAATNEIVARMGDWNLLGSDRDALDLGCGIGRFLQALAPRVRSITGLDISPRMVAEARTRCTGLSNVRVDFASGRDLALIHDASLDLVLAADVFPYLVQAGGDLAAAHIAEFARILRPGGAALVLNYSYRGSADADRQDCAAAAGTVGLDILRNGTSAFSLWDGVVFLMRKPARSLPNAFDMSDAMLLE